MRPKGSAAELEARRLLGGQLLQDGKEVGEVVEILGVSQSSVNRWRRAVEKGGMDALKANNIADKDIQTQQFNVYPEYSYDQTSGTQSINGYNVTNTVNVKLRDINHVGTLIDAVVAAGGNLTVINNVNFTVEDPTKYYDDARQKAVDDAKQKAQDIANSYGVALGKPILVIETSASQNPYNNYYNVSAGPSVVSSDSGNSFNAGSTDIVLDIQASYTILSK